MKEEAKKRWFAPLQMLLCCRYPHVYFAESLRIIEIMLVHLLCSLTPSGSLGFNTLSAKYRMHTLTAVT